MGKRQLKWSAERRATWLAEGRGSGEGASYRPWIDYHSLPSTGSKYRVRDTLFGLVRHLMSVTEKKAFLVAEASPLTCDIWEQYRLPLEETLAIAHKIGVKHPFDNQSGEWADMTTDLVITREGPDGRPVRFPYSVKPKAGLTSANQMEHEEIARRWWVSQGAKMRFVTDDEACLPTALIKNLLAIRTHFYLDHETRFPSARLAELKARWLSAFAGVKSGQTFTDFCIRFGQAQKLETGEGIKLGMYMLARRAVLVPLNGPDVRRLDVDFFRIDVPGFDSKQQARTA